MQQILTILQQILQEMRTANARNNGTRFYFYLAPPHVVAIAPGRVMYKILPDGAAFHIFGSIEVPLPYNPYPETLWRLNLAAWVLNNRRWFPLATMALVGLVALNFLLAVSQPGYAAQIIPTFSAVLTCLLIVTGGIALVAFAIWNFGRGVSIPVPDAFGGHLSAGLPDVGSDTLVMSESETETPEQFAVRVHRAISEQDEHNYLVVFAYKSEFGVIVYPPGIEGGQVQERFRRDCLTADLSEWKQEVCTPRRFDRETWSEFVEWVHCFSEQYRTWAAWQKSAHNPLSAILNGAKVAATCLLLFFATFGANAQSAQPLPHDAGKSIFQAVPDSAELEKYKQELMLGKYQIGREIAPRQKFIMWTFHNFVLPILFFFGLLAWFWAKAAFRESEHDAGGGVIFGFGIAQGGHYARRGVFIIAGAIAVVELVDTMATAFFTSKSLWWAAIQSVCIAVVWMFFVNWITPNPRVKQTSNLPPLGGNNFPRIG